MLFPRECGPRSGGPRPFGVVRRCTVGAFDVLGASAGVLVPVTVRGPVLVAVVRAIVFEQG